MRCDSRGRTSAASRLKVRIEMRGGKTADRWIAHFYFKRERTR
jgi:hypothetical protein